MPFPILFGVPEDTPEEVLKVLRRDIVATLASKMRVPANWIHPFFPKDLLGEPEEEADGSSTIYVSLDTAMFHGVTNVDALAKEVTQALAEVVWEAFSGRYEVEVFIGDLNKEWKYLIKASS